MSWVMEKEKRGEWEQGRQMDDESKRGDLRREN